ncbi:hypothetical protein HPP92_010554 [Vanilla planifolia]|uniref:Uncharacterized protein n=1 Tax=Vanilla planifolia TaxID=51239 RepID=A0A835V3K4_VANPL|nr:hypothetical protein HPP92_010554 [Vanilla planifolia]
MATSKLLIASLAVALMVYFVVADSETEKLRSRISAFESSISDVIQEIKRKDDIISKFELLAKKKFEKIDSLQREIDLVQKNGASDVQVAMEKAQNQFSELQKQINRLRSDIKEQATKRASLETQAYEADKKEQELVLKLDNIQKVYDEQKLRVRNTEHALQKAEEELMKVQLEAASKSEQLIENQEVCILCWLTLHVIRGQEKAATYWNNYGKPTISVLFQKVSEKSARLQTWTESNLHLARAKLVPSAKEKIWRCVHSIQPHGQVIFTKSIEVYRVSKESIMNHIVHARELADPYLQFQEAKNMSKLYVDHIANLAKRHIERLLLALNSYDKHAVHSYKKFVTTLTSCHDQVRASIHEHLEKSELTKPLATTQLEWFLASALLALPLFFLYRLLWACFCEKTMKIKRFA